MQPNKKPYKQQQLYIPQKKIYLETRVRKSVKLI